MTDYYVTKYALTVGIIKLTKRQVEISDGYLYYRMPGKFGKTQASPKDWFCSLDEAEERVSKLRFKKIAALRKQILKLSSLDIPVKTLKELTRG